ncbi:MAG TPA: 4-(cytidine 5'-diphospho)-2-C-methyl-D-erythritol kinase [Bryobacteraceae bacterium]|nr:4-(cytidine 5'-diphospho)-2-C-methyl-D-erythritol kinase [Bryobacteraceae bacterium]
MRVTVPSFAKLNLDLRVLHKRPDGFHELRTVFQTISLKDNLTIDFDFAKRTQIDLLSSIDIADNLVVRSAKLILEQIKVKAWVRFVLDKQIPMGAGLGGGSSNAAAVLLALPALAGKRISLVDQVRSAETLGSDVPFFLHGGTALGLGRGTELYPLPDQPAHHVVVVSTGVHVSTGEAYRSLERDVTNALTSRGDSPILREFQTVAWALEPRPLARASLEQLPLENDFEKAVFKVHPELAAVARKLRRLGAKPAMMTGSGSAIFGVFASAAESRIAARHFPAARTFPVRFVNRRQYRGRWLRALGPAAAASAFAR